MRSIEFDDLAEAAPRANVEADVTLWKVSGETEISVIIENIIEVVVPVVGAKVPSDKNFYAVSVNRANMRNGVIAKLERRTAVQLLPSFFGSWVKLRVVETIRVGWIPKKLLKKAD